MKTNSIECRSVSSSSEVPTYTETELDGIQTRHSHSQKLELRSKGGTHVTDRRRQTEDHVLAPHHKSVEKGCQILASNVNLRDQDEIEIELDPEDSSEIVESVQAVRHRKDINPCEIITPTSTPEPTPIVTIQPAPSPVVVPTVSYSKDIAPVISNNCTDCHSSYST